MTQRLRNNLPFLRLLKKLPASQVACLIKASNNDILKTLQDCHLNVLKGTVKLTPREKKKLATHKMTIKQITTKKIALGKKRRLLEQKGGQF